MECMLAQEAHHASSRSEGAKKLNPQQCWHNVEAVLTIAVPTYNGAGTIRETLESVAGQLEPGVDILVSDNASTDATRSVMREYQQRYPSILYSRNDTNVGPDRNFDLAVRGACGKYVWLLSDDDKLSPGAIRRMLDVLERHRDIALVFVNSATYSADFSRCLASRALAIPEDLFCRTADEFLQATKELACYVSSCVVRRDLWIERDLSPYVGSNWLQYAARLALLRGHSAYCIADSLVVYRSEAFRWERDGMLRNNVKLARMIGQLAELGYSKSVVRQTMRSLVRKLPLTIFIAKTTNLSLDCGLMSLLAAYGIHPSFWILDVPLLLVPRWSHRLVWRLYQVPPMKRYYRTLKASLGRLRAAARSRREKRP